MLFWVSQLVSVKLASRCGLVAAKIWATAPPVSLATRSTGPGSTASHRAATAVARPVSERSHASVVRVWPWPGRSTAMHRCCAAYRADHVAPEDGVGEHTVDEQRRRSLTDVEVGDLAEWGGRRAAMGFKLVQVHRDSWIFTDRQSVYKPTGGRSVKIAV